MAIAIKNPCCLLQDIIFPKKKRKEKNNKQGCKIRLEQAVGFFEEKSP